MKERKESQREEPDTEHDTGRWKKLQWQARHTALYVSAVYALAGGLWILFSDRMLAFFVKDPQALTSFQTFKGWFYIMVTAGVLYVAIERNFRSLRDSEQALFENRRTLSTLLSNLPGMAYRCRNDRNWTMEFVSDGCRELTGYDPSDLIDNRTIAYGRLIHPDDRDHVWKEVQTALQEQKPFQTVYRIKSAAGEEKWVWEKGRGVFSLGGELAAVEGFITEITEYKKSEEALRESEGRYRALVESSSDAIVRVDNERRIMSYNRAFLDLFGFSKEEVEGQSIRIVHPSEESFLAFGRKAYPIMKETGPLRTEWVLKRKDGTIFPIEGSYAAVRSPDGSARGYVGIIRDITQRKKAEEELKRYRNHLEELVKERTRDLKAAEKALVQKEKLKTLGTITAEVAHEIRNPLVVIGGFAKRLQKKFPDLHELDIILTESQRLEKLLGRIRHYLKSVEIRFRRYSINALIAECIDLISSELEKEHIILEPDLDLNLPLVYTDPDVLTEVFINLIRNAVKIIDKKRALIIKTFESDQNIHIDFRIPVEGRKIKDPEHLFLPFDEGGQSIAVPLSYRLLKDMGGILSVTQDQDRVVFAVSLMKALRPDSETIDAEAM